MIRENKSYITKSSCFLELLKSLELLIYKKESTCTWQKYTFLVHLLAYKDSFINEELVYAINLYIFLLRFQNLELK